MSRDITPILLDIFLVNLKNYYNQGGFEHKFLETILSYIILGKKTREIAETLDYLVNEINDHDKLVSFYEQTIKNIKEDESIITESIDQKFLFAILADIKNSIKQEHNYKDFINYLYGGDYLPLKKDVKRPRVFHYFQNSDTVGTTAFKKFRNIYYSYFVRITNEVQNRKEISETEGNSKFLLLYGPPGTGKTRAAKREYAPQLIWSKDHAFNKVDFESKVKLVQFHPSYSYEDFIEGIKPITTDRGIKYHVVDGIFKAIVKIASSKDTENKETYAGIPIVLRKDKDDIIISVALNASVAKKYWLKGNEKNIICFNDDKTYKLEDFKLIPTDDEIETTPDFNAFEDGDLLYIRDEENWGKGNYVLIIDEFSRGNVPKIFGELLFAIADQDDDEKYQMDVNTQYSNSSLKIPKNLSIIATMNTADRSVIDLDQAMRRRFQFIELLPNLHILDCKGDKCTICANEKKKYTVDDAFKVAFDDKTASGLLKEFNIALRNIFKSEPENQIGHSYFFKCLRDCESLLNDNDNNKNNKEIKELIENNFQLVLCNDIYPAIQAMAYGDARKVSEVFYTAFKEWNNEYLGEIFEIISDNGKKIFNGIKPMIKEENNKIIMGNFDNKKNENENQENTEEVSNIEESPSEMTKTG